MLLMMIMKVKVPKLHHHSSLQEGVRLLQAADKVTDHRSPKAQLSETIVLSFEQPIQLHTFQSLVKPHPPVVQDLFSQAPPDAQECRPL